MSSEQFPVKYIQSDGPIRGANVTRHDSGRLFCVLLHLPAQAISALLLWKVDNDIAVFQRENPFMKSLCASY